MRLHSLLRWKKAIVVLPLWTGEIIALKSEMELKRDLARNSVLTIIERDNERVSNNPMIQQTDNADSRVRSLEVPENE